MDEIVCYLSLTGRTDCCCWLVFFFFFLKTLNCCFCSSWGGGRDGGDFSSCLVLFVLSMSLLLRKYFCFSRREGNKIHCAKRGIFRLKNEIALFGGLFGVFNVVYPNSLI